MPPSPRLSARRIRIAYLREMIKMRDQRMSETTPRTASGLAIPPALAALVASFSAYGGLVPISPYTTPSAPSVAAVDSACSFMVGLVADCFAGTMPPDNARSKALAILWEVIEAARRDAWGGGSQTANVRRRLSSARRKRREVGCHRE